MSLLSGAQLRRVFEHYNPFTPDGRLKPEEERVTIVAANANPPFELQARAFVKVAAGGNQSPLIIQLSQGAVGLAGEGDEERGAMVGVGVIRLLVKMYGARFVALALDHFRPPAPGSVEGAAGSGLAMRLAREKVLDACEAMARFLPRESLPSAREIAACAGYLCSGEYASFRRRLAALACATNAAWAMVDTESLPLALNFAVTRDIADLLGAAPEAPVVEAELGATGAGGAEDVYRRMEEDELREFAELVAGFVVYTGAGGVSYPIGMRHGARSGEKHEPDEGKLARVQGAIMARSGRYVPFAQHGGTGAARLCRGLVAKNNVNTMYLAAAANTLADHVGASLREIRAGDRRACGPQMFGRAMEAVGAALTSSLERAGSLGKGEELARVVWPENSPGKK